MPTSHTDSMTRVAGAWLALASFLLAGALIFHGPLAGNIGEQMATIAAGSTRWAVIHWAAAAALSAFAIAGLLTLTAGARLTRAWWTISAWAVLSVGALWTMTTAVVEAAVIARVAAAGNTQMFEAWWAFSEGKATGFAVLALALAVIAGNEARTPRGATPAWSSWVAVVAGIASFLGWALGMWLGFRFGSLVWVVSSLVMCLWTLWFGAALMRKDSDLRAHFSDARSSA